MSQGQRRVEDHAAGHGGQHARVDVVIHECLLVDGQLVLRLEELPLEVFSFLACAAVGSSDRFCLTWYLSALIRALIAATFSCAWVTRFCSVCTTSVWSVSIWRARS